MIEYVIFYVQDKMSEREEKIIMKQLNKKIIVLEGYIIKS